MSNIFLEESQFKEIFESHTKIETYSRSIDSLFYSKRMVSKIDHAPYYQRNYVWDDAKATYFIESILLGTEIPPLIFFDEGNRIEVIDGRQRFETIKRFIDGQFALSRKGLTVLSDLSRVGIDSLREKHGSIYDNFISAKVRIIGIKLINNPPVDPILIDKIKKEIFGRYNSGITPLRKAEIDNAVYNSDSLSAVFKKNLTENLRLFDKMTSLFLRQNSSGVGIETVMQFIRKSLVMPSIPIRAYATGKIRSEIISKFYEFKYGEVEDPEEVVDNYWKDVEIVDDIYEFFKSNKIEANRVFYECFLWAIFVTREEGFFDINLFKDDIFLDKLVKFYLANQGGFVLQDSHYAKETLTRYKAIAHFFEESFSVDLSPYIDQRVSTKDMLADITPEDSGYTEALSKLESLRITKPDPSRNKVEDLVRAMNRNRFMIRPSYQRKEVINLSKASALIESVLLGIMLPAIFVYKRNDGVSEVIDGQQRILTILGFLGESYLDENGKVAYSRNNNFKLRDLRILKHLKGNNLSSISEELQDKIWDFDLFVVEIEERVNPEFNPVDLFIRLNDKPFPIKEHSFEMWNSWVDKDILDRIKEIGSKYGEWLYLKKNSGKKYRDRMLNEELISILAFFECCESKGMEWNSYLDIHQKVSRINARIKRKYEITNLFTEIGNDEELKRVFLNALDNVDIFFGNLIILINDSNDLSEGLDYIISSGSSKRYFSRSQQDFYLLWFFLRGVSLSNNNAIVLKSGIISLFSHLRRTPEDNLNNVQSLQDFLQKIDDMKDLASF